MSVYLQPRRRARRGTLLGSLVCSTQMVEDVTSEMYDHYNWQKNTLLGHNYSVSRTLHDAENASMVQLFRSWLGTHEEAQVMLGSVLVVVGLWWLVRAVLSLMIHLICPVLVVLLAVVCVPQLRAPLLGQNYPALANLLRSILIRLADNIKTT